MSASDLDVADRTKFDKARTEFLLVCDSVLYNNLFYGSRYIRNVQPVNALSSTRDPVDEGKHEYEEREELTNQERKQNVLMQCAIRD